MFIEWANSIALLITILSAIGLIGSLLFFNKGFVKKYKLFEIFLGVFLLGVMLSFLIQQFLLSETG